MSDDISSTPPGDSETNESETKAEMYSLLVEICWVELRLRQCQVVAAIGWYIHEAIRCSASKHHHGTVLKISENIWKIKSCKQEMWDIFVLCFGCFKRRICARKEIFLSMFTQVEKSGWATRTTADDSSTHKAGLMCAWWRFSRERSMIGTRRQSDALNVGKLAKRL